MDSKLYQQLDNNGRTPYSLEDMEKAIKEFVRMDFQYCNQYRGIWYQYRPETKKSCEMWKLGDLSGYVTFINASVYRLDQCFDIFEKNKTKDVDWRRKMKRLDPLGRNKNWIPPGNEDIKL